MELLSRGARVFTLLFVFGLGSHFALEYGEGGLWKGLRAAHAVVGGAAKPAYDLTELRAVNAVLDAVRKTYVEPQRIDPRQMFLSALDRIQMEVAPVIVTHSEKSPTVKVQILDQTSEFRVDNVQGPWDVAARLREVFAFIQPMLRKSQVDLAEVEYAAANGILRTLDPHSVFLPPEDFREMKVSTSGRFGGLGIVISLRDQMLTVMRPMPGTPAGKAGLKRLDRIVRINRESTLNMPLEDAVDRLRGDPGTPVVVWVTREGPGGWTGMRPFELVREVIQVASVEKQKLDGGIGYVRIKQFQERTAEDLAVALADLKKEGSLGALVIDLRDDPGGLLDQAAKVADLFLEQGVIYATEGYATGRSERQATRPGTQPNYPIVVLVNGSSASASEIVSGALKNQNRAIVIGETTFGKGSVQQVFPDVTPEGAALKLTVDQYLTPGDISIQGTGVTPDVKLEAMTADGLEMNLLRDDDHMRERDLNRTLGTARRHMQEPPEYVLRFNLPESVRAEIRDRGSQLDDEFRVDAPIRLAREVAAQLTSGSRQTQLEQIRTLIGELGKREQKSVATDLKNMGVDWSLPAKPGPVARAEDLEFRVSTDRKDDTVIAGEPLTLSVSVTNHGTAPVYQLYGVTKSDTGYYDERELIFGKVEPGATVTRKAPFGFCVVDGRKPGSTKPVTGPSSRVCRIPRDAETRQDGVRIEFGAEGLPAPQSREVRPTITALPRPEFSYSYHVVDNREANKNGQLERGEGATLYLKAKNVGLGPSFDTQANLRNLTGDGLLLGAGRFDLSGMKPAEERELAFTFDVLPALVEPEVRVELSIVDADLAVGAGEKITLPVVGKKDAVKIAPVSLVRRAEGEIVLREEPGSAGRVIGKLPAGSVVSVIGTVGTAAQVRIGGERFAFTDQAGLKDAPGPAPEVVSYEPLDAHTPPVLQARATALATRGDSIEISAEAADPKGTILDLVVFVGNRKVYYRPNSAADKSRMALKTDVPLHAGVNAITIIARKNEEIASRRTLIVRKDGPNGELVPTPKNRNFGEDWEFDQP